MLARPQITLRTIYWEPARSGRLACYSTPSQLPPENVPDNSLLPTLGYVIKYSGLSVGCGCRIRFLAHQITV